MAIEFDDSADRHDIPHDDVLYAMTHYVGTDEVDGRTRDLTRVFVGKPHEQAKRYIEVIAKMSHGDIVIFHAMELSDNYRYLLHEE